MRITVCELPDDRKAFVSAWEGLLAHIRAQQSDLVLLPELPFYPWFPRTQEFDAQIWQSAQAEHDAMMDRLPELAPAVVLGTRLVTEHGLHLNRGFYWTSTEGYNGVHDKYYFPDEENFYEQHWFDRHQRDFTPAIVQDMTIGFLICTEVMFNEWARYYGKQGANIIAVPRASSLNYESWLVAMRMAAIASGAFVISSNRADENLFQGRGVVIHPNTAVLAETSHQEPFITVEIDLAESIQAKKSYPRDVLE